MAPDLDCNLDTHAIIYIKTITERITLSSFNKQYVCDIGSFFEQVIEKLPWKSFVHVLVFPYFSNCSLVCSNKTFSHYPAVSSSGQPLHFFTDGFNIMIFHSMRIYSTVVRLLNYLSLTKR